MTLHWRRAVKKAQGTNITFVRVTSQNVEEVRTLWKHPEANPGTVYIKWQTGSKVIASETFRKYYRILGSDETEEVPTAQEARDLTATPLSASKEVVWQILIIRSYPWRSPNREGNR